VARDLCYLKKRKSMKRRGLALSKYGLLSHTGGRETESWGQLPLTVGQSSQEGSSEKKRMRKRGLSGYKREAVGQRKEQAVYRGSREKGKILPKVSRLRRAHAWCQNRGGILSLVGTLKGRGASLQHNSGLSNLSKHL